MGRGASKERLAHAKHQQSMLVSRDTVFPITPGHVEPPSRGRAPKRDHGVAIAQGGPLEPFEQRGAHTPETYGRVDVIERDLATPGYASGSAEPVIDLSDQASIPGISDPPCHGLGLLVRKPGGQKCRIVAMIQHAELDDRAAYDFTDVLRIGNDSRADQEHGTGLEWQWSKSVCLPQSHASELYKW